MQRLDLKQVRDDDCPLDAQCYRHRSAKGSCRNVMNRRAATGLTTLCALALSGCLLVACGGRSTTDSVVASGATAGSSATDNGTNSTDPACLNDHDHYEQFREQLMVGERVRPCVFDTDCVAVSPFTTCAGCESDAVPASDVKAVMEQLIEEDKKDCPICYPAIDFQCADGPPAVCLSGYCALDLRTHPGG